MIHLDWFHFGLAALLLGNATGWCLTLMTWRDRLAEMDSTVTRMQGLIEDLKKRR